MRQHRDMVTELVVHQYQLCQAPPQQVTIVDVGALKWTTQLESHMWLYCTDTGAEGGFPSKSPGPYPWRYESWPSTEPW
jgi:hypothetical protein